MTRLERSLQKPNCPACGLSGEQRTSLELALVHEELAGAHALLSRLKPALIIAAYHLSQYAHHLHDSVATGSPHPADLNAREAFARRLASDLMDAYGHTLALLPDDRL